MPQIDAPTVAEHRAQQREALLDARGADPARGGPRGAHVRAARRAHRAGAQLDLPLLRLPRRPDRGAVRARHAALAGGPARRDGRRAGRGRAHRGVRRHAAAADRRRRPPARRAARRRAARPGRARPHQRARLPPGGAARGRAQAQGRPGRRAGGAARPGRGQRGRPAPALARRSTRSSRSPCRSRRRSSARAPPR